MKNYSYKSLLSVDCIDKIKKSSRLLTQNISGDVEQLNKNILSTGQQWKAARTSKGFHIETEFQFKNETEAVEALLTLCDLQESCDHHAHFVLENCSTLRIELCTHQPNWGVSYVDLAFAQVLTLQLQHK